MKVDGLTLLQDYQRLLQAAQLGLGQAQLSLSPQPVEVQSLPEDEVLIARAWSDEASPTSVTLVFAQGQDSQGNQVLEFGADQRLSWYENRSHRSQALVDMTTGRILKSQSTGTFLLVEDDN